MDASVKVSNVFKSFKVGKTDLLNASDDNASAGRIARMRCDEVTRALAATTLPLRHWKA